MYVTFKCPTRANTPGEGNISPRSWPGLLETQEVHGRSSRNSCIPMNATPSQMLRLTRTFATDFASSSPTSLQRLLAKFWSSSHPENIFMVGHVTPLFKKPGADTLDMTNHWPITNLITSMCAFDSLFVYGDFCAQYKFVSNN